MPVPEPNMVCPLQLRVMPLVSMMSPFPVHGDLVEPMFLVKIVLVVIVAPHDGVVEVVVVVVETEGVKSATTSPHVSG